MDRAQKVSLVLFAGALVVLAADLASSLSLYWFAGATFFLLLMLSGATLGFDFAVETMKLRATGKAVLAIVITVVLLVFLAPTVLIFPSATGSASHCNPNGCSSVTEMKSVTDYLWCVGWEYTYSPPPASEFYFQFYAECPPPV